MGFWGWSNSTCRAFFGPWQELSTSEARWPASKLASGQITQGMCLLITFPWPDLGGTVEGNGHLGAASWGNGGAALSM